MITYNYRCTSCYTNIEVKQRITDSPLTKCCSCKKETLQKVLQAPKFILKGSDFPSKDIRSNSMTRV